MPSPSRIIVATAVVGVLLAAAVSRADDAADIRASARAFSQALSKGDTKTVRKYAFTDEAGGKFLDAVATQTGARKKLVDAAVDKFGPDGKTIDSQRSAVSDLAEIDKQLEGSRIVVNGDAATVTSNNGKPLKFKRDGGIWKIDFRETFNSRLTQQIDQVVGVLNKRAGAMEKTAAEIKEGKYKTVDEAKTGLFQNIAAAIGVPRRGGQRQGNNNQS